MEIETPAPEPVERAAAEPTGTVLPDTGDIALTFLVDEAAFQTAQQSALLGGPDRHRAERQQSVYFDTESGDLWRAHLVLRMRSRRGANLMTLKAEGADPADSFLRHAIEAQSPTAEPDLTVFEPPVAAEVERIVDGRPLLPRFSTDIRRKLHHVAVGGSKIDVAFDAGFIAIGNARVPVREIALELQSGDAMDLFATGLALTQAIPARLGVISTSERGMQLSTGRGAAAVRALSPVSPDYSVDDIIGAIIGTCIRQFIANWPAFEASDGPEAVHQMRVAMRRLRAALALFQREFPCAAFMTLRDDAKRLASAMGEARNWDVFADLVRTGPAISFPDEPGFEALLAACDPHRAAGHEAVASLLQSTDTTRFVLSALEFVARRGWRNTVPGASLPRLAAPASGFAALSLERLHRRVHKRGKRLHQMAAEERHQLRIALKNLRYATDFFGKLFPNASTVRTYARAAAKLQDVLGAFNDMAMVTEMVERLHQDSDIPTARASGIMIGWYGRGTQTELADLHEAWDIFRKAKPFWTNALRLAVATAANG